MAGAIGYQERIGAEAARLVAEFGSSVGEERVRQLVDQTAESFSQSKIAEFEPLLVARYVREQLKEGAAHV